MQAQAYNVGRKHFSWVSDHQLFFIFINFVCMSMGKQVYSYKTALIILKIINRPKKEVRGCEHCTDPTQSYAFHMLNVTQHFGNNRTTFLEKDPN